MTRIAQTLLLGCCVALACDPDDSDDQDGASSVGGEDDAHGSEGDGSNPPLPDGVDACDQASFQDAVVEHCES